MLHGTCAANPSATYCMGAGDKPPRYSARTAACPGFLCKYHALRLTDRHWPSPTNAIGMAFVLRRAQARGAGPKAASDAALRVLIAFASHLRNFMYNTLLEHMRSYTAPASRRACERCASQRDGVRRRSASADCQRARRRADAPKSFGRSMSWRQARYAAPSRRTTRPISAMWTQASELATVAS